MISCSDAENYYKLDKVVSSSRPIFQAIFRRRWRKDTSEAWVEDTSSMASLITHLGKKVFKDKDHVKKSILESQSTDDWDGPTLSLVITNLKCSKEYEIENEAIKQIGSIRNQLAHRSSNKRIKDNFKLHFETLKNALKVLKVTDQEIDNMVAKANAAFLEKSLEAVKQLFSKAKNFLETGEHEKAVECYTEAIKTPSLLPADLAMAYENRGNCHLEMVNNATSENNNIQLALMDASKALDLDENSWRAHYLAAKCYKLQSKFPEAIHHYQRALAISPVQQNLRIEFEACKFLMSSQNRNNHHSLMPLNLQETVDQINQQRGTNITTKQFIELNLHASKTIKGQYHVFRGQQYSYGWEVAQDYVKALNCYEEAAKLKNTEGMYLLACCYHFGYGVQQDFKRSFELYMETAKMHPNALGEQTRSGFNYGVANSEHVIALMYDDGIYVPKNHPEAARWYQRAMDHGIGTAANNLGIMYLNGLGVKKDTKLAEKCLNHALSLGNDCAPASLFGYYVNQMEPDLAWKMVYTGRKMGNTRLTSISDQVLNRILAEVQARVDKTKKRVEDFEKLYSQEVKGLTYYERLCRYTNFEVPGFDKTLKLRDKANAKYTEDHEIWGGKAQDPGNQKNELIIGMRATFGSETAKRIAKTWENGLAACNLIENLPVNPTEHDLLEVINWFYEAMTLEPQHLTLYATAASKIPQIITTLYSKRCDETGDADMKVRFCYVAYYLYSTCNSNDTHGIEVLKEGLRRYPNNISYYKLLSDQLGFKGKHKEGLQVIEAGLEKFPTNCGLLWNKAVHMRQGPVLADGPGEIIAAFETFLGVAPEDHQQVPEAYYQMGMALLEYLGASKSWEVTKERVLEQVSLYVEQGEKAEQKQLPCYLPYVGLKPNVKTILESYHFESTETIPEIITKPTVNTVLELKPYLKGPSRKTIVREHRKYMADITRATQNPYFRQTLLTKEPKLTQTSPKRFSGLKKIALQEMDPIEDHIFRDRFLILTIMDEIVSYNSSHTLIAEDENGDVTRLYIYNVCGDKKTLESFMPGSRIGILNPYMRIGAHDVRNGIRNDDPNCIVYLKGLENMCRFCGQENAPRKCTKCKRPYCSRECQKLDWQEMKHNLICCDVPYVGS